MSLSDSDGLQVLLRLANRQIIHGAASATFLLYDLLTTLDEEVEYVWSSANALPKYLYFVSRYIGLIGQLVLAFNLVPMFCFSFLMFCFGFLLFLLLSVEFSLMLRIDALYGKSRRVRLLLGFAFAMEMVTSVTLNIISFPTLRRTLVPFPSVFPMNGCIFAGSPTSYRLSWVPILVFETLLFTLNAIKCISYGPLDHTPLIYRLFRDGSAYYVISVIFMLVCTISQFFENDLASIAVVWVSAVLSYSGCHLLLSLRKTAARRQRLETSILSADIPHIHMPGDGDIGGDTFSESESHTHTQTHSHSLFDTHSPSPSRTQSLEAPHPYPHSYPPPLRLTLDLHRGTETRIESIELVPRLARASTEGSGSHSHAEHENENENDWENDWALRCARDWDLVDEGVGVDGHADGADGMDGTVGRWGPRGGGGGGRKTDEEQGRAQEQEQKQRQRQRQEHGQGQGQGQGRGRESDDSAASGVRWLRRWKP